MFFMLSDSIILLKSPEGVSVKNWFIEDPFLNCFFQIKGQTKLKTKEDDGGGGGGIIKPSPHPIPTYLPMQFHH